MYKLITLLFLLFCVIPLASQAAPIENCPYDRAIYQAEAISEIDGEVVKDFFFIFTIDTTEVDTNKKVISTKVRFAKFKKQPEKPISQYNGRIECATSLSYCTIDVRNGIEIPPMNALGLTKSFEVQPIVSSKAPYAIITPGMYRRFGSDVDDGSLDRVLPADIWMLDTCLDESTNDAN